MKDLTTRKDRMTKIDRKARSKAIYAKLEDKRSKIESHRKEKEMSGLTIFH